MHPVCFTQYISKEIHWIISFAGIVESTHLCYQHKSNSHTHSLRCTLPSFFVLISTWLLNFGLAMNEAYYLEPLVKAIIFI